MTVLRVEHELGGGPYRITTAQPDNQSDVLAWRRGYRARAIRRVSVAASGTALLVVVALPSGAQDVCSLTGPALQTTLETGAAEIARRDDR